MALVFSIGTYSVLDSTLTLWLTLAIVRLYLTIKANLVKGKLGYLLVGLAFSMGFMTVGFLELVLLLISIMPVVIFSAA